MTKKDKLIIEIEYDHSPCHYSDGEMEEIVNNWSKKILKELQDPRSALYPHFMAMAMINAKNIVRQANVSGSVCPDCLMGRDEFEPDWRCPECRRQTDR